MDSAHRCQALKFIHLWHNGVLPRVLEKLSISYIDIRTVITQHIQSVWFVFSLCGLYSVCVVCVQFVWFVFSLCGLCSVCVV